MDDFDSNQSSEEDLMEEASFSKEKLVEDGKGSKMESLQCHAEPHSDEELINI